MVIKSEDVEILMGHGSSSRGLKANYYRPKEEYLLQQYLKVVDLLTVNEEQKLSIQVKELLDKDRSNELIINSKLQEKDEQIKKIREETQNKDDILTKLLEKVESLEVDLNKEKKWRNSFLASYGN